MTRKKRKN